jgi:hypothetical protein
MPANYENREFDSTRLFAFLRGYQKELLLIVANFDHKEQECTVNIPAHAFAFFNQDDPAEGILRPLLHKEANTIFFTFEYPFSIKLGPFAGEIYRISF